MKTFFFFFFGDRLKNFCEDLFFFGEHLRFVSLVLGFGFEHSCPWPRECLSSERLSLALASDFFCVLGSLALGLDSSLVSSTPPLLIIAFLLKRYCSKSALLNSVLSVQIDPLLDHIICSTLIEKKSDHLR